MGGENEEIEADTIPILEETIKNLQAEKQRLISENNLMNYDVDGVKQLLNENKNLKKELETKTSIIKALNQRLSNIGGQC